MRRFAFFIKKLNSMKNNLSFLFFLAAFGGIAFCISCKKNNCEGDKTIETIAPSSNPPGYEVIIGTKGFSSAAEVRFGNEVADTRTGEANQIIARVPVGLAGNIQVTVEEGDCVARFDNFKVLGALPGDLQPSLPDIVLPSLPSSYPDNFTNAWFNAADPTFTTGIQLFDDGSGSFNYPDSFEFNFSGNSFFNDNPVSGTVNIATNKIHIEVDRTAKSGGTLEKFDGQFVVPPANAQHAILLVSRQTGRQLLLLYI